jgi:hypothetical protein
MKNTTVSVAKVTHEIPAAFNLKLEFSAWDPTLSSIHSPIETVAVTPSLCITKSNFVETPIAKINAIQINNVVTVAQWKTWLTIDCFWVMLGFTVLII